MLSMMNGYRRWWFLTVPLLAALGCSDPVPRPSQGNLRLSIKQSSSSTTCPVTAQTYYVGNPKPPTAPPDPPAGSGVNPSIGDRFIDGEKGATIKCAVHGSGPYTFSGTIKAPSNEGDKVTLTITNGVVNADKATGTATVAAYTPQLLSTFTSAEGACTVAVVSAQVKAGSIWASVTCPIVTEPSTAATCSIANTTD